MLHFTVQKLYTLPHFLNDYYAHNRVQSVWCHMCLVYCYIYIYIYILYKTKSDSL